jgi:hypothetical protein
VRGAPHHVQQARWLAIELGELQLVGAHVEDHRGLVTGHQHTPALPGHHDGGSGQHPDLPDEALQQPTFVLQRDDPDGDRLLHGALYPTRDLTGF